MKDARGGQPGKRISNPSKARAKQLDVQRKSHLLSISSQSSEENRVQEEDLLPIAPSACAEDS